MKSMLKMLLSVAIGATISSVSFADNLGACPAVQSGNGIYDRNGTTVSLPCSMGDANYSVAVTLTTGGPGSTVFVANKSANSFVVGGPLQGGSGTQTFNWIAVHN